MKLLFFLAVLVPLLLPAVAPAAGRPMTLADLFQFRRVSDPQVSPDGKTVAYVVGTVDLEANKVPASIWLASRDGTGEPRQLTNAPGKKDSRPRWSPDGQRLLFQSNRSGETQLWVIDVAGGEARQLTTISTEAANAIWSPDGKLVAFTSAVWPEYSDKPYAESNALNKKRKEEAEKSPVKARVFTKLFYRHWDELVEDRRQHLFVVSADGGEPRDVTPGDRDAFPTSSTFESAESHVFSPDSTHLVFNAAPAKDEAWSTNYDLCRVPVTDGAKTWETLTAANEAADSGPSFSPDGQYLAYRAQKKAGYEADKWDLLIVAVNRDGSWKGTPLNLTASLDRAVDAFVWGVGRNLVFTCEENAATALYQVTFREERGRVAPAEAPIALMRADGVLGALSVNRKGMVLTATQARLNQPPEVVALQPLADERTTNPVTRVNAKLLSELDLPRPESVKVDGAGGTPMQMWILKPPGFDPNRKWPLVYLVHGGPQGVWEDGWSTRWNASTWAAQGYVVALPNPRGSTGFGQKYVDEISGDWGGKCYEDLMKGLAHLEKQPWIDTSRMASAGGSFGGYMMNWFAVNTNKFKCLVTHCSVYNFESMYGTTDEVWFDEYEHGGPPWGKNRDSYEKHSPHRLAANLSRFRTPMLVIHNDLDFRCPIGQGHELFTALQRQGVSSRFVNFPDEGHWVLKPRNSEHWHKEVFAWLKRYAPPGGK